MKKQRDCSNWLSLLLSFPQNQILMGNYSERLIRSAENLHFAGVFSPILPLLILDRCRFYFRDESWNQFLSDNSKLRHVQSGAHSQFRHIFSGAQRRWWCFWNVETAAGTKMRCRRRKRMKRKNFWKSKIGNYWFELLEFLTEFYDGCASNRRWEMRDVFFCCRRKIATLLLQISHIPNVAAGEHQIQKEKWSQDRNERKEELVFLIVGKESRTHEQQFDKMYNLPYFGRHNFEQPENFKSDSNMRRRKKVEELQVSSLLLLVSGQWRGLCVHLKSRKKKHISLVSCWIWASVSLFLISSLPRCEW